MKVLFATFNIKLGITTYCHYAKSLYMSCFIVCYTECHYAERRYTECHHAECHYAECYYAECHNAECRGTVYSRCKRCYSKGQGVSSRFVKNWFQANILNGCLHLATPQTMDGCLHLATLQTLRVLNTLPHTLYLSTKHFVLIAHSLFYFKDPVVSIHLSTDLYIEALLWRHFISNLFVSTTNMKSLRSQALEVGF
jgi:hypothetical protein